MNQVAWIGVDWGTTNARAYGIGPREQVVAHSPIGPGMTGLSADGYEAALLTMIEEFERTNDVTPVLICGMAGARQGWLEAPYRNVPCAIAPTTEGVSPVLRGAGLSATILPGLSQTGGAPDVMRGEETQILGFASLYPGFRGVLCLPGTHSKWARIEDGRIVSFRTSMTGELFDVISRHTVLRHSVSETWCDQTFRRAVLEGYETPQRLPGALFGIRAGHLLGAADAQAGRAHLSGLLIGTELATEIEPGVAAGLIGDTTLAARYRQAMEIIGVTPIAMDGETAVTTGLIATRRAMLAAEAPQ